MKMFLGNTTWHSEWILILNEKWGTVATVTSCTTENQDTRIEVLTVPYKVAVKLEELSEFHSVIERHWNLLMHKHLMSGK